MKEEEEKEKEEDADWTGYLTATTEEIPAADEDGLPVSFSLGLMTVPRMAGGIEGTCASAKDRK